MDDRTRFANGMSVRRGGLRDADGDRAGAGGVSAGVPDLPTRHARGGGGAPPRLDPRPPRGGPPSGPAPPRDEDEFCTHVEAALRNGLSREEIAEVLLQVAVYAGVPAANRAFHLASRVMGT